ncbi:MAG: metallophosphoesterase [Candidatus Parvarchaeum sp.]
MDKDKQTIRIVAFSDWRTTSIEELIDIIKTINPKPDLILYAGDDIERFESLPTVIPKDQNKEYFSELANFSKHGLCYVLGNDCSPINKLIKYKHSNVFDVNDKPFVMGDFAIIGQEGAIFDDEKTEKGYGLILYKEREIYNHLIKASNSLDNKKLIVVSHCPPYGILDHAIRFGEKNIGSKSLYKFIQNRKPLLVICGHVHSQGGRETKLSNTVILNVASHDDQFARGNIAIIDIASNNFHVNWIKTRSNFELAFENSKDIEELSKNLRELQLTRYEKEYKYIIDAAHNFGKSFIADFPELFWSIRMSYHYSIKNIIELYKMGVRNAADIREEHVKKLIKTMPNGIFRYNVWQAYLREKAKMLKKPIIDVDANRTWIQNNKIAYFDSEYVNSENVVLYGFLVDNKIVQFDMTQKAEARKFVEELLMNKYKIFHYAGQDRQVLINLFDKKEKKVVANSIINVFFMLQKQLGLPIKTMNIHVVAAFLKYGKEINADNDGFSKLKQCEFILSLYKEKKQFRGTEDYKELLKTNKADLIDLKEIIDRVRKIK